VNVCKSKKLTNMRASGSDDKVSLAPPVVFSLEDALEYIRPDEYVEVTPVSMRMRKIILDETERKRQNSFTDNAQRYFAGDERLSPQEVEFTLDPPRTDLGLERPVNRFPFVPNDPTRLEQDCYEAYNIQVAGLVQRLRAIGNPKIVIGGERSLSHQTVLSVLQPRYSGTASSFAIVGKSWKNCFS